MTLTMKILMQLLEKFLEKEGVLYSACELRFFEEIIFKEKNIKKFIELINKNAFKISTIKPFDPDEEIEEELAKINSKMI